MRILQLSLGIEHFDSVVVIKQEMETMIYVSLIHVLNVNFWSILFIVL